jgi:hypothetical protein
MTRKRAVKRRRREETLAPQRLTLRVTLRYIEPAVWREIIVPNTYSLLQLHQAIQLVFDWLDYHLFQFHVGPRQFERAGSDLGGEDATAIILADLGLVAGSRFLYVYDMGDGWEHDVEVHSVEDLGAADDIDPLAYLTDGARAAPPEDVGGPPGYAHLLAALARRSGGDDQDLIAWAGADFDPELFDRRAVNHALVLASAWRVI